MPVSTATKLDTTAPPARLWEVLTQPRHWADALPDLANAQVTPAGPLAVGSVITTARRQVGRTERSFRFAVEELVPERVMTLSGLGRGHRSIIIYEITPSGAGSELRVAMTVDGTNPLARLIISLFTASYQRHMLPLVEARTSALIGLAERLGETG